MLELATGSGLANATSKTPIRSLVWWLCASAAVILVVQIYLAISMGINWDEFQYYDQVRRLSTGELVSSLQTFHGHLFGWLLVLPGDVTDHIRVARLCMLLCEIGAGVAIFGLARRFASKVAAALAAIAYISAGYVVTQGTAFRADPEAAFLLMCALWFFASRPLNATNVVMLGLLTGIAAMVTVKVVIYAPAFLGIALLRWGESPDKPQTAWRFVAGSSTALLIFGALYAWHSSYIAKMPADSLLGTMRVDWGAMFSHGLFPQMRYIMLQVLLAPHVTVLICLTLFCWRKLKLSHLQRQAIVGLMLPLATLAIYQNSYPYFFVFLLPPVLAACAPALEQILLQRYDIQHLATFMATIAVLTTFAVPHGILAGQKRTIAVAHRLFPRPITYFDFSGTLGDYDRALSFMPAGWGLQEYRSKGIPEFVRVMEHKTVPLLVANHTVLLNALVDQGEQTFLLKQDADALHDNYLHFWGRLWVAGKSIAAGELPISINVRVPGLYTLEGGALVIDGVLERPGNVVSLARGIHRIGGSRMTPTTLTWGNHMVIPEDAPPNSAPFESFLGYPA